jgi:hypothetical protein
MFHNSYHSAGWISAEVSAPPVLRGRLGRIRVQTGTLREAVGEFLKSLARSGKQAPTAINGTPPPNSCEFVPKVPRDVDSENDLRRSCMRQTGATQAAGRSRRRSPWPDSPRSAPGAAHFEFRDRYPRFRESVQQFPRREAGLVCLADSTHPTAYTSSRSGSARRTYAGTSLKCRPSIE